MKIFCNNCGIHFPTEFKETLLPKCNFWGDRGLGNLPLKLKEEVWFWLSSIPADKISGEAGIDIIVSFKGRPSDPADTFSKMVPNWDALTEKQRQTYQKIHFRAVKMGKELTHQEIMKEVMKVKKEVIN